MMCISVIVVNGGITLHATNAAISQVEMQGSMNLQISPIDGIIDTAFVVFYTIELALKLIVHRGYFFVGEESGWGRWWMSR